MALQSRPNRLRASARRRHHASELGNQEQGDQQTGKPGYGPEPIHRAACFSKKSPSHLGLMGLCRQCRCRCAGAPAMHRRRHAWARREGAPLPTPTRRASSRGSKRLRMAAFPRRDRRRVGKAKHAHVRLVGCARPRNQVKNAGWAMTQPQATAARSSRSGFDRRSSRSVRQKAAPPLRKNDCSGLVTTR
jgi:hypothetical protein